MKQHITRAYNSFLINKELGTIVKESNEDRLKDEINYYKLISNTENSIFFPRYISSSFDDKFKLELEYYAYDNLGDYMVYREFDSKFWSSILESLRSLLFQFSNTKRNGDYDSYIESMYINKTEKYYYDLLNISKFAIISSKESLIINGQRYLNFENLWDDIKIVIRDNLIPLSELSIIHGDFCFSNILCGVNAKTDVCILKCVDPRGHFGEDGIFGDPYYDYSKLMHSYDGGYEYIIYDQYDLKETSDLSSFGLEYSNDNKDKIKSIFVEELIFNGPLVRLIQGLIYIGMCSRHYDDINRQTAMYMIGIKLLNEVLEEC